MTALPPLTAEALRSCAASPSPAAFYMPDSADLQEGVDLTLVVDGGKAELPAHTALVALRATALAPLMAMPAPRRVALEGVSLPLALLFMRCCYRPEECAGLVWDGGLLEMLPDFIPVLHRWGALGLLGPLVRGEGLPGTPADLMLRLLDSASQLAGLELLAGHCAAALVNEHSEPTGLLPPPCNHQAARQGRSVFLAGLTAPPLALEGLSHQAVALLCRTALAGLAATRWREYAAPVRRRGQEVFTSVEDVTGLDASLAAACAARAAGQAAAWEVGTTKLELTRDENYFSVATFEVAPVLSDVFSLCGHEWRVRLVPLARPTPGAEDDPGEEEAVDEMGAPVDGPPPQRHWMNAWLEAVHPEGLPQAGLQVCVRLSLERGWTGMNDQETLAMVDKVETLSPDYHTIPFHPLYQSVDSMEDACYDAPAACYRMRLRLQLAVPSRGQ